MTHPPDNTASPEKIEKKHLDSLSRTLFVMWGFPELSQTFIERELRQMHRLGGEVNVLAAYKVEGETLDPVMQDIVDRTVYFGHPVKIVLNALGYLARRPGRFLKVLGTMVAMPHRTLLFRARSMAMVFAAAAVIDRLKPRDYRFIQAHFAAYHTELAMALSMFLEIPFGITAHATGIWKDRNILKEKIARAEIVATCTAHNRDHLADLAGPHRDKVRLVYHGLSLGELPSPTSLPQGETTRFLAIGRMVEKKGFDHLLEAARLLEERGVSFEVAFIGEGPLLPALEEQTGRLGLREKVRFLGKMSNTAVFAHIADAHCLVVPSVRAQNGNMDGIPNVILEALALGRPVIGSDLSGIPEVVHHEETGLIVPPGDPAALADAMMRIARDRGFAEDCGAAGRAFVETHFDVRENVKTQLALLHDAWNGPAVVQG